MRKILQLAIIVLVPFLIAAQTSQPTKETIGAAVKEVPQKTPQEMASELYEKGMALYEEKKFAEAGDLLVKASSYLPENTTIAYNAACCYSLAGDKKSAMKMIEKAYDLGWLNFEGDSDLDYLRDDKAFKKLNDKSQAELLSLSNDKIEPVVVLPENYDDSKSYGLLVLAHGFGANPEGFTKVYEKAASEFDMIILSSRASDVRGRNSFAWNKSDEEHERILGDIKMAFSKYKIDAKRVVYSGFSQGGGLTYTVGLPNSELFAGLIPVAGMYKAFDFTTLKNKDIKIFTILGSKDRSEYLDTSKSLVKSCEEHGIEIKHNIYDIGHTYPENRDEVLIEALNFIFGE